MSIRCPEAQVEIGAAYELANRANEAFDRIKASEGRIIAVQARRAEVQDQPILEQDLAEDIHQKATSRDTLQISFDTLVYEIGNLIGRETAGDKALIAQEAERRESAQ